jgi:hypothetical protein
LSHPATGLSGMSESLRLLTIPSSPSLQAWRNTISPSWHSMCSSKCSLAHVERLAAEIRTLQFNQVEGVEEDAGAMPRLRSTSKLGLPSSPRRPNQSRVLFGCGVVALKL